MDNSRQDFDCRVFASLTLSPEPSVNVHKRSEPEYESHLVAYEQPFNFYLENSYAGRHGVSYWALEATDLPAFRWVPDGFEQQLM